MRTLTKCLGLLVVLLLPATVLAQATLTGTVHDASGAVLKQLGDGDLSIVSVARQAGLTPKQVQRLFPQWEVVKYLNAVVPWPFPAVV